MVIYTISSIFDAIINSYNSKDTVAGTYILILGVRVLGYERYNIRILHKDIGILHN